MSNASTLGLLFAFLSMRAVADFYISFGAFKKSKLIKNTPMSNPNSITPGIVKLEGKVKAVSGPVVSPFSKRNCAYFEYEVTRTLNVRNRATLGSKKDASAPGFLLCNENDSVLVTTAGAELLVNSVKKFRLDIVNSAAKRKLFRENLEQIGFAVSTLNEITTSIQATEFSLRENQNIFVFGTAKPYKSELAFSVENRCVTDGANSLIISDMDESEFLDKLSNRFLGHFLLGIGLSLAAFAMFECIY